VPKQHLAGGGIWARGEERCQTGTQASGEKAEGERGATGLGHLARTIGDVLASDDGRRKNIRAELPLDPDSSGPYGNAAEVLVYDDTGELEAVLVLQAEPVLGTAVSCAAVQAFLCVGGAVVSACECLPLVVDEFKELECPGFG
jgi:hypothetical protein